MTNQELYDLIACFDRSTLQAMKLSMRDFSIELSRGQPTLAASDSPVSSGPSAPGASGGENTVTAPMVGTFYAAPAPDQPPFVAVGDRVSKGQTLCLMEAMKMMSEVPAPCDCIIREVLKANGELAEFGQPLFRYEPC